MGGQLNIGMKNNIITKPFYGRFEEVGTQNASVAGEYIYDIKRWIDCEFATYDNVNKHVLISRAGKYRITFEGLLAGAFEMAGVDGGFYLGGSVYGYIALHGGGFASFNFYQYLKEGATALSGTAPTIGSGDETVDARFSVVTEIDLTNNEEIELRIFNTAGGGSGTTTLAIRADLRIEAVTG